MTLSSIISQRPANAIGEAEVATSRLASAKARTMPADPRNDDFLLPLLDAARHINNYADALARAHGLTQPQLIVIARLERKPRISLDELAGLAGVTQTALTRLIDDLETLGMVECCSDPADRQLWLRLTPAAAPLVNDIKSLRANLQRLASNGIDPAVLKTMVVGLRRTEAVFGGVDHIAFG
jgi:DNA-binding MarR family transcriptional regulator